QGTSISQNADEITSVATRVTAIDGEGGVLAQQSSQISQNADNIGLRVEAVDTSGNSVVGAKMEIGTIDGASYIMLDADKVLIDGSIKAQKIDVDDLMATELTIKNLMKTENNKVVISADGSIQVVDGVFSGTINANNGKFSGDLDITPSSGKILQLLSSLGTLLQWTTSTYTNGAALYNALTASIAPNMNFNTTGSIQIQQPSSVSLVSGTTSSSNLRGIQWLSASTAIAYTSTWNSSYFSIVLYKTTDYGVTWVSKATVSSYSRYATWSSTSSRWIIWSSGNLAYQYNSDGTLLASHQLLGFNSSEVSRNFALTYLGSDYALPIQLASSGYIKVYKLTPNNSTLSVLSDVTGIKTYLTDFTSDTSFYIPTESISTVLDAAYYRKDGATYVVKADGYTFATFSNIDYKSMYSNGNTVYYTDNTNTKKSFNIHTYSTGSIYYSGSASGNDYYASTTNNTNLVVRPDSGASESAVITVTPKIERIFNQSGNLRILARTYSASGSTYSVYQLVIGSISSVSATKFQFKKYGSGASEKIVIKLNDSNTSWVSILFTSALITTSSLSSTGIGKIDNFDYIEATAVYGAVFN
ncbi:MAG: hypothetical protein ACOWWR_07790, partial [Eubacteriales bacterium]